MTKSIRFAFLASIILNLLLIGVILGRVPAAIETASPRAQRMEQTLKKLPEPAQSRLREKLAAIRTAGESLRAEMDSERAEALRLLSAEPFDEAAYGQQVDKIGALRSEMFKRLGAMIKTTAKELTPEERRMLADVLRRRSR